MQDLSIPVQKSRPQEDILNNLLNYRFFKLLSILKLGNELRVRSGLSLTEFVESLDLVELAQEGPFEEVLLEENHKNEAYVHD